MEPDLVLVSNTREWLLRAKEDLDNAQHDLMATPPFVRDALFHCQQVVEKAMKDILTWHDSAFRKQDVMDTVQRQRGIARRSGYLTSNDQIVVSDGPYITIMPVNPGYIVVPYYDPAVVFFAPRPGFAVGGAIRFGFGVTIGGFFAPWGWGAGGIRFDWGAHAVFLNNARWGRTWANRSAYVHPYATVRRPAPGSVRPAEAHALHPRSEPERNAPRQGRPMPREEHRGERR